MVPGGVSVWTREQIVRLPPEEYRAMSALIDEAGVRSARAQGLPAPITSTVRSTPTMTKQKNGTRRKIDPSLTPPVPPHSQDRMLEDQRLYLACSDATRPNNGPSILLGILKVGPKRLFIAKTTGGGIEEMEPRCAVSCT